MRGVTMDVTGTIFQAMWSDHIDGVPQFPVAHPPIDPPSPALHGNEGIVVSGTLGALFVVGGTVDGTPGGAPNGSAWKIDVGSSDWEELPLPQGDHPHGVVASTFVYEETAIYMLDQVGQALRLWRLSALGDLTSLGPLREDYAKYETRWLVAGEDGEIVLVATTATPSKHEPQTVVALLGTDHHGKATVLQTGLAFAFTTRPLAASASQVVLLIPDPSGAATLAAEIGPGLVAPNPPPGGATTNPGNHGNHGNGNKP
jgi:hypothetical protein